RSSFEAISPNSRRVTPSACTSRCSKVSANGFRCSRASSSSGGEAAFPKPSRCGKFPTGLVWNAHSPCIPHGLTKSKWCAEGKFAVPNCSTCGNCRGNRPGSKKCTADARRKKGLEFQALLFHVLKPENWDVERSGGASWNC